MFTGATAFARGDRPTGDRSEDQGASFGLKDYLALLFSSAALALSIYAAFVSKSHLAVIFTDMEPDTRSGVTRVYASFYNSGQSSVLVSEVQLIAMTGGDGNDCDSGRISVAETVRPDNGGRFLVKEADVVNATLVLNEEIVAEGRRTYCARIEAHDAHGDKHQRTLFINSVDYGLERGIYRPLPRRGMNETPRTLIDEVWFLGFRVRSAPDT